MIAPKQTLLTTFEARRSSHQTHIIHRNWTPTPYISFTSSPEALENLANFRKSHPRRKRQTVTVVDPAVRLPFPMVKKRTVTALKSHMGYHTGNSRLTTYASGQSKQKKSFSITTGTSFFRTPTGIIILSARISRGFVKKGSAGSRNRFNIG